METKPSIRENRRWERCKLDNPQDLEICYVDSEKALRIMTARVLDAADGGVALQSPVELPPATRLYSSGTIEDGVHINLYLQGACVVSSQPSGNGLYRVGVEFRAVTRQESAKPIGVWHTTPRDETLAVNATMCSLLEIHDSGDLAGHPYGSFVETYSPLVSDEDARYPSYAEAELVGVQGTLRRTLVHHEPLFSYDHQLAGYLRTFTDLALLRPTG